MHVNVKIYIRFQILLVWTFTEYYINIFGGAERYSGPPRNNFGGAAAPLAPPLPTPLNYMQQNSTPTFHGLENYRFEYNMQISYL